MIEKISKNLFELRRSAGKTQKEVAKDVGISAVTLSAYENGQKEPLLSFAIKLASYYGVSLDSLCGVDTKENKPATAADVLQTITDLKEYPLSVDLQASWNYKYNADHPWSNVSIRITEPGEWLTEYVQNYNKISELIESAGLDSGVLDTWKKSKIQEMRRVQLASTLEDEPEETDK